MTAALTPARLEQLHLRRRQHSDVPCAGCTACCRNDRVMLGPDDDPGAYEWHEEDGFAVLDRRADGACVYLDESGCSIRDRRPEICRRMDCRVLVALTPQPVRVARSQQNPQLAQVYAAGLARMDSLEATLCH